MPEKTARNLLFNQTSLLFCLSLTKISGKIIKNYSLLQLCQRIASRRDASPEDSYVAKLLSKGPSAAAQKVVEEAGELAIAAVSQGKQEVVSEAADLVFHLMVLCESLEIDFSEVVAELEAREGISGLEEKASRGE